MLQSPFSILGVPDGTPKEECKKVYRKLCAKHHPDNGGDPDMFDKINKAWKQIEEGVLTVTDFKIKRNSLQHSSLFSFV